MVFTTYARRIFTVERTTKTLVCVPWGSSEIKFRKSDGRAVGRSSWGATHAKPYDEKVAEEILAENKKVRLVIDVRNFPIKTLSIDQLERIFAIMNESDVK